MNAASRADAAIYPLAYAARLAGLDPQTAARWIRGYTFKHRGERRTSAPVVHVTSDNSPDGKHLTFAELLTLRLVRAFRERGLGLPAIRRAAQIATERYGVDNPFVTKSFRTVGRSVFLDLEDRGKLRGSDRLLVNALTGQQQFREVVEPSLFKDVVFAGAMPEQWFPRGRDHSVVIRPDRSFGAPHIAGKGVRTDVIADAVAAEGRGEEAILAVARWFGLTEKEVRDAVAAEAEWQLPKAA